MTASSKAVTELLSVAKRKSALIAAKQAAAAANTLSNPELQKLIEGFPAAANSVKNYSIPLVCQYTGITMGLLAVKNVAGYMPYLGQWKETQVQHPLFSFSPGQLLTFARNSWFRFCAFSAEESADEQLTSAQEQILQVTALALLHQLTTVNQSVVWLPTFAEVQRSWSSLLAISYWKNYIESKRLRFPSIRLSKLEPTIDLHEFLQLCWKVKKQYETAITEAEEAEKLKAAERLTIALRDDVAGKKPVSYSILYRWFTTQLPSRYNKDAAGWMRDIFFAKTSKQIEEFSIADIDIFEEIFLCEVPVGSSMSHAFLSILNEKRELLVQRFDSFEIVIPQAIQEAKAEGTIPAAEPKKQDFPTAAAYMIAHARWVLAHTDLTKHAEAAAKQQFKLTVSPSFVPSLGEGIGAGKSATERLADALEAAKSEPSDLLGDSDIDGDLEDLTGHDDSDLNISGETEE